MSAMHRLYGAEAKARNERIIARLQEGLHYFQVAAEFGLARKTVQNIAKAAGLPRRKTGPKPDLERRTEISHQRKAGKSVREIAQAYRVSPARVYQILNSAEAAD